MRREMTINTPPQTVDDIEELKKFFGTKSTGAAIRTALAFAQMLVRTAKDGAIIVRDQVRDEDVRFRFP